MDILQFKYLPLTFISSSNEIKEQIENTIIFRYFLNKYNDTRKLGALITGTQYGYNASAQEFGNNKILRITDIKKGKVNWDDVPYVDCDDESKYLLKKDDIVIARTGGTTGKSFLINNPPENAIYAGYLIRLRASDEIMPEFIYRFLNSYVYWSQISEMKIGSAQPNVNAEKLKQLIIPYAPIDYQEKLHKTFINNDSEGEFSDLAELINNGINNFDKTNELLDVYSSQLGSIAMLRQTILQEAVQGKLVPQDPNDEPASELLNRIKAEKEQLIADKIIRKEKPLQVITDDEILYKLPNGWEWCRFLDAVINRDGERIPLSREDRQHRQGEYDYYGASGVIDKIDDFIFDKELLLIGEDGANLINRSTPIAFKAKGKYWVNNHAHVIDAIYPIILDYYKIFVNSIDLKPYVTGTAQPKMNQSKMNNILVSLPPLAEQKRIVAKVDELMSLCDQLEEQIHESKDNADMLMQAVLQEAFEA